jgi:hypothetical protein
MQKIDIAIGTGSNVAPAHKIRAADGANWPGTPVGWRRFLAGLLVFRLIDRFNEPPVRREDRRKGREIVRPSRGGQ